MKKALSVVFFVAVALLASLTGCNLPEQITRSCQPAHINVDVVNGKTVVDLFAGTVPLGAVFYDMGRLPRVDTNPDVVIVDNVDQPYWYWPGAWWTVDLYYNNVYYPPVDESKVRWGLALRYDDEEVPMTIHTVEFVRGSSTRIILDDLVPDRVQDIVEFAVIAIYPNQAPVWCSPWYSTHYGTPATFCWARLKCLGNPVWLIAIDGEMGDESYDENGCGTGLITLNWSNGVTPPPQGQVSLSVSVSPVGAGTVSGTGNYNRNTTAVAAVLTTAQGYRFDHWTGDASGTSNTVSVFMDTNKAVTAVFVSTNPPPSVCSALVDFTRSGSTGTMRINPDGHSLREITANASANNLPSNADFSMVNGLGVEVVNIPSPYWFIREVAAGTMTAGDWSSTITLDGIGTDADGNAKTLPLANWTGGKAIPFYTLAGCNDGNGHPRRFYLNTGVNAGMLNSQMLGVDTTGYIWP